MDMDTDSNAENEEELQVEETDDSCKVGFTEIAPVVRGTNNSIIQENLTGCVSGDLFGEVRENGVANMKQEPHDVCCVFIFI